MGGSLLKRIFVSGTSKGLGRDIALHYLNNDVEVLGLSRSSSSIEHPGYSHFQLDLMNLSAIDELADSLASGRTEIDGLINNAAQYFPRHSLRLANEEITDMIMTNFAGTFKLTQALCRKTMRKNGGRVVFIGSIAEKYLAPGDSVYAGTKKALKACMVPLSKELFRSGITCNYLGISLYDSGMYNLFPQEHQDMVRNSLPSKSLATIEEVVHALDFFLSPDSSSLTGQSLYLGGVS